MAQQMTFQQSGNDAIKQRITQIANKIKNKKPVLKRIGINLLNEIDKSFQRGGNDKGAWAPDSPVTIARKGSSKVLVDTGLLRGSYIMKVGADFVDVGTPVRYASPLQEGTKDMPASPMLPSKSKTLSITKDTLEKYIREITRMGT